MRICRYRKDDAAKLSALYFASVSESGRRHYTRQQVEAWARCAPDPAGFDERAKDGRLLLVAEDDHGDPVAYGDLEANGHIDHIYCWPDMVGKGIASALYDELERAAQSRRMERLTVEASEAARAFFMHKGFTELERRDLKVNGISIHNYAMAKVLETPR